MEILEYPSPNFGSRREDTTIQFIILHYTAMDKRSSLDRLCSPDYEVSCHYLIDSGGICYQLVDDNKRAWHAGKSNWKNIQSLNRYSIGIEIQNSGHEKFFMRNFVVWVTLKLSA